MTEHTIALPASAQHERGHQRCRCAVHGRLRRWLWCLVLLVYCAGARAEPAAAGELLVVVAGDEARAAKLLSALGDPARRLSLKLNVVRTQSVLPQGIAGGSPARDPFAARVWLDLTNDTLLKLYLTDRSWSRVCARELEIEGGFDEVAVEQAVFIVRTLLEAFLSGQAVCVRREDFARSLPPRPAERAAAPPPAPKQRPQWRLSPTSGYEVQYSGVDGKWAHGSELGARFGARSLYSSLTLHWRLPLRIERDALGVELQSFGLRLLAGYERRTESGWLLSAALGPVLELTRAEPYARAPQWLAESPLWGLDPALRSRLGFGRAFGNAELWLVAGIDGDLARARYVVNQGGSRQVLFSRNPLRPFIALELAAAP